MMFFSLNEEGKVLSQGCKLRLEAATKCDILYLFGQGSFIYQGEKSGNFEK